MEGEWERLRAHVMLTEHEVRERIELALPGASVVSYSLIEEGHANSNYCVDLRDGTRVLLRHHVRDRAGARREAALCSLVRGRVPTPHYRYVSEDGVWSVQEWLEGTTMLRALDAGERPDGRSVGETLAQIGSFTFETIGFLNERLEVAQPLGRGPEAYTGHIRHLLGTARVREKLGDELTESAERWLDRDERLLDEADPTPRLTHADYKPTNLLTEQGRLVGVLDWEFAHAGMPILDISILMRDPRLSDTRFAADFEDGFLAGGGTLPKDWMRAANLLDTISLFQFLDDERAAPIRDRACVDTLRRYLALHYR